MKKNERKKAMRHLGFIQWARALRSLTQATENMLSAKSATEDLQNDLRELSTLTKDLLQKYQL